MGSISLRVENRNSSFELLRIVAMLFIIAQHLLLFVVFSSNESEDNTTMIWSINSFLYIGANVFILISGYFSIKPKVKTFLNLYFCIAFYKCLCYIIDLGSGIIEFSLRELLVNIIFCISHSNNWFIEGYIFLFLFSPVLNIAIQNLDKKNFLIVLTLLTVSNIYFGYFWKLETFNLNGYNGHQFIYLYFIGRYINRYIDVKWVATYKKYFLMLYLLSSFVFISLIYINTQFCIPHWDHWKYNNPLLLVSAISFFLCFCGLTFNSKLVNFLSAFSFPAFLIHLFPIVLYSSAVRNIITSMFILNNRFEVVALIFCGAILIYLFVIPVELVRLQIMTPLLKFYDYFHERFLLLCKEK